MKLIKQSLMVVAALCMCAFYACSVDDNRVTVETELARLRTTDHLFLPQKYERLVQYSGFHRKGQNPDRMHCLYEDEGWRVVADHKGKGVVSRIWTTYPTPKWGDIKVEVDGQVIYEGDAMKFFDQGKLPFVKPLCDIRSASNGEVTAEGEVKGAKKWAVSYAPIPFARRFRYMQREVVYANINIKEYAADTEIQSFTETDWTKVEKEFSKTADVWNQYANLKAKDKSTTITKSITIPVNGNDGAEIDLAKIEGTGIIRSIKIGVDNKLSKKDLAVNIYWDGSSEKSVTAPLYTGFGSMNHRTMAFGTQGDWQYLNLPMPFAKGARVTVASQSETPVALKCQITYEKVRKLPKNVLYLYSKSNKGFFKSKVDSLAKHDFPINDFFYNTGYTALDIKGAGHIAAYMDRFHCQPELDEHIFIDDERTFPDNTWNGTGHEDLFDMAWGHKPVSSPMTSGGSENFKEVNAKFFLNDPMVFHTAIKFNWEWSYKFGIQPPRDARFASVVYWYSSPITK